MPVNGMLQVYPASANIKNIGGDYHGKKEMDAQGSSPLLRGLQ